MASLKDYVDMNAARRRGVEGDVNLTVIDGDGMFNAGDEPHYIECGLSAIDLITRTLHHVGKKTSDVTSLLDFGCGYGRVLRWLKATFPAARLMAVDTDPRAVSEVAKTFDVDARSIERRWGNVPHEAFDLVWVGSLFTHLSQGDSLELLRLLRERLSKNGVLAATMHGRLVVARLRSGERAYGLSPDGINKVLIEYDAHGYGFSSYSNMPNYGISVCNLGALERLVENSGLYITEFVERGWVKHQDFFSCCASSVSAEQRRA